MSISLAKAKRLVSSLCIFALLFLCFAPQANAIGLLERHADNGYAYTKYDDNRYSVDLYVDDNGFFDFSGEFCHGINSIVNGLWGMSRALSNFTVSLVKQAYTLNFIEKFADVTGENVQRLAGVNASGVQRNGLFFAMLMLLVLVVGFYFFYTGLVKRQVSKALGALLSFVSIFALSLSFLAYAPEYIGMFAGFSKDFNTGVISATSKIAYAETDAQGDDAVELIANNLWLIQVKQPWLILQYGSTDVESERSDALLSLPYGSKERAEVAKTEVEKGNVWMSAANVGSRFGMTLLLLIVNLAISIFVILLCSIMLLTELFFILFVTILPIILILGMFPNQAGRIQKALVEIFNLLVSKTAISVIATIAFSLSMAFYTIAQDTHFLFVAFLQILIFAGIFLSLNRILGLIGIDLSMQGVASRRMFHQAEAGARKVKRSILREKKKHERMQRDHVQAQSGSDAHTGKNVQQKRHDVDFGAENARKPVSAGGFDQFASSSARKGELDIASRPIKASSERKEGRKTEKRRKSESTDSTGASVSADGLGWAERERSVEQVNRQNAVQRSSSVAQKSSSVAQKSSSAAQIGSSAAQIGSSAAQRNSSAAQRNSSAAQRNSSAAQRNSSAADNAKQAPSRNKRNAAQQSALIDEKPISDRKDVLSAQPSTRRRKQELQLSRVQHANSLRATEEEHVKNAIVGKSAQFDLEKPMGRRQPPSDKAKHVPIKSHPSKDAAGVLSDVQVQVKSFGELREEERAQSSEKSVNQPLRSNASQGNPTGDQMRMTRASSRKLYRVGGKREKQASQTLRQELESQKTERKKSKGRDLS